MIFGDFFAGGIFEDVKALGVGLHETVFDAVVHHFDEMPSSRRAAMDVTLFRSSSQLLAPWSAWNVTATRSERFEYGIELLDSLFGTTNHHAVAAIDSPDSAARAHVDVVNSPRLQLLGAANVVLEIRVAAVNEDVASF